MRDPTILPAYAAIERCFLLGTAFGNTRARMRSKASSVGPSFTLARAVLSRAASHREFEASSKLVTLSVCLLAVSVVMSCPSS